METTNILGRPSMPLPVSLPAYGAPVFDVPAVVHAPDCVDGWRREPLYVADLSRTQGLSVFGGNAFGGNAASTGSAQQQMKDQSIESTNGMVGATRGRTTGGVPPRGRPD